MWLSRCPRALILFSLLTTSMQGFPEDATEVLQSGAAQQLLPQLQHLNSLEGEFSQQRHIRVLSLPLISTGSFNYKRGQGLIWETLTPIQNRVEISPGQGIVMTNNHEAVQTIASSQFLAEIFLAVFSGDMRQIETLFTIENQSKEQQPSDNHWTLRLTPNDKRIASHISSIHLKGSQRIEAISLREANGDSTEISLQVPAVGQE